MKIANVVVGLALAAGGVVSAPVEPPVPMALVMLNPSAAPERVPAGWQLKVNRGVPDVTVISQGESRVLRFRSNKSSFAIERAVDIDINRYPLLTWNWKVSELPAGADFRHLSTDDQAAQVLVVFADHRVLSYIWDTSAPKGTFQSASSVPLLHIFAMVCQSGAGGLNQWTPESHNLARDYEMAYNRPPSQVKGLRLQINTQHTGGFAESYFGDVSFEAAR
ncbi:MAG: DUF3047 domain-containing protein [Candidatus Sulfopaludibacter sp.]|nr:DUF3047 domain-containing protein [Candidatus Sulfopaludibacter sp.]